jgi:GGDEF domain-containing protein
MVGLLAPNRPPSMALEYISPGIQPSDPMLIGKLLMGLQQIVVDQGSSLVVENVAQTPALSSLQNFLKTLQVESLAAILLREESQPMGLLVLEQCGSRRAWKLNELSGLEALAEQIVLSVTNVRLRNLMRTLAVTDERSGLLHRDSYVPCLLSEAERMQTQQKPLTGALLQFSQGEQKSAEKPLQPPEEFLQSVSGTIVAHLRQNDIAIRYGPLALALVLPGTSGKEAVTVVEKLRRLVTAIDPVKAGPPRMTAFLGEAVQERGMESVDVVTELINRLDIAAGSAPLAGDASTRLLGPSPFRQS